MSDSEAHYIGIDLGGTEMGAVLTNDRGRSLDSIAMPTIASEGEEAVFGRIAELAKAMIGKSRSLGGDLRGIGIGAPGPLDAKGGRILVTENLPFVDFPIAPRLESFLGYPVFLDNDGNVAALGEYYHGAGRNTDPMLYLTVSTGIGAGVVIDGKILRGRSSNALEAGHMTVEPEGPVCACGNRGCAEALASGTAIARAAGEAVLASRSGAGPQTGLSRYESPGAREVFSEAARGDLVAGGIASRALTYLGICVANLVTLFDPELLVIGGGVAKAGAPLFEAVRKAVRERCARAVSDSCRIVPASLGSESGTIGAAALAAMALRDC